METAAIERIDGTESFRLTRPLRYAANDGRVYTVQTGFRTDGASIPRALRWLAGVPIAAEYLEAAILHDAVCRSGWFRIRECDDLMAEAMVAHGVDPARARVLNAGLAISRLWRRRPSPDPDAVRYLTVRRPH